MELGYADQWERTYLSCQNAWIQSPVLTSKKKDKMLGRYPLVRDLE
jgi:hypothetical protein